MDEGNLGWSPSSTRSPPVTVRPMTMGDGRNHHLGVVSGGFMYVAMRIYLVFSAAAALRFEPLCR